MAAGTWITYPRPEGPVAEAADDAPLEIAAWRGLVRVQGAVHRELDARLQSAVTFSWSASAPIGQKVDPASNTLNGTTIDPAAPYRVTVDSLLADGSDGFTVLLEGTDRIGGGGDLDAFIAYLTANPGTTGPTPDRKTPLP